MQVFLIKPQSMNRSRRDVLRAGAGLASAGILSSLAGCGALPFGGGGIGGGNAFYRDWLVEPDAIDSGDHYSFTAARPADMDGNDEFSDTDAFDSIKNSVEGASGFGPTDVDFEDVSQLTSYANGSVQVATGSFTVEDVTGELDDNDYDDESELESGEQVFLSGASGQAYGVAGGHIIGAFNSGYGGGGGSGPDQPSSGSGQQNASSVSYGETVTSTITDDDSEDYEYGTYEELSFQGSAGEVVTIQTATADNYNDVYLYIEDPDGNLVTDEYSYNNDIYEQTLSASGEYTIIVGSYDAYYYDDVTYSLSLELVYSPDELVDTVETVAGVQNGDTESYGTAIENASPLFDALGGGVFVTGSTFEQVDGDDPENGTLEDSVAQGLAFSFGDEEFNVSGVVVYDTEDDVDTGDVEDWADEGTSLANGEIDDVETSSNGRVGTFSGVVDYDDLFSY